MAADSAASSVPSWLRSYLAMALALGPWSFAAKAAIGSTIRSVKMQRRVFIGGLFLGEWEYRNSNSARRDFQDNGPPRPSTKIPAHDAPGLGPKRAASNRPA